MSTPQNATYSMSAAQLLEDCRKKQDLNQGEFFGRAGIFQSSWSHINRGTFHFTLKETRSACTVLGVNMREVLADVDDVTKMLPDKEGVQVLDSLKGSENKSLLPTIIADSALGYLILRLLKK